MGNRIKGFTLIELMIVVVVVAILAAIALPSYHDFVRKSRRADALTKMLDAQLVVEKERANRINYVVAASYAGVPTSDFYSFFIVAATNSYTVIAKPVTGKGQEKDTQYGTNCGFGLFIDEEKRGHYAAAPGTSDWAAAEANKTPSSPSGTASECWRK